MAKRFSIITITYNAEKTLLPTLRSIIEQDFQDFEYIIIDGASTDGTLALINRYQQHVDKLISEPDQGLYDAMNKGLKAATGEFILFLNAGDSFHSNFILRKVNQVINTCSQPLDVIYGQTALVNEHRDFIGMRRLCAPKKLTWKSFKWGMLVCHQSFFARRELAPLYNLHYRYSADFDWCINVLKASRHNHNMGITLSDYLHEGLTTQNRKASLKERYQIMVRNYGQLTVWIMHLWFALRTLFARITGQQA